MSQAIGAVVGQMQQGRTDVSLLADFVERQDAEAFRHLVERHAGLVWSVCKRIVRQHHAAEDAFQATFVVLMQKAPRLRLYGQLSSWLYGVAVKIARRTQARDARLHSEKGQVAEASISDQQSELTVRELMEVVQEEVQRLPRRYQPVLELCLFNQMSTRQAAERLQLSPGMVRGCLERGRKQLQARLLRRGIAPLALGTLSLTALNAHPVSVELVALVQGMVNEEVPARLMALTATSLSGFRPVVGKLALVLLMITGVGLGMVKLFASTAPEMPVPVNSVQSRGKPSEKAQGFVDDHQGKPVAHAKVEVFRNGKLEQTIQADGVGRFEIPEAWSQQPVIDRTLIVRQGEKGLGWSSRISQRDLTRQDVHIVVLPFEAVVRGKLRNEQGKTIAGRVGRFFWLDHPINGSLSNIPRSQGVVELPGSMNTEGRFSVSLPIQTGGMVFVGGDQCIDQRIPYHSIAAGLLDVGEVTLKPSGTIKGVVLNDEGKPLAGVVVNVQSYDEDSKGMHFHDGIWGETISDQHGRFQIEGLEPRASFHVYLKEPYLVAGQTVPLTMRARNKVLISVGKPTELVLTLEPAKKITGRLIDAVSKKPLAHANVSYQGVQPFTLASVIGATTDEAGDFLLWAPAGRMLVFGNDGNRHASVEVTIPENEQLSKVTLEANKVATPHGYLGSKATMAWNVLQPQPDNSVFSASDAKQTHQINVYQQLVELKVDQKLPTIACWRVYSQDKALESATFMHRFSGIQSLSGNTMIASIPEDISGSLKLEIDLEGFQPSVQAITQTTNRELLTINLTSAQYLPIQIKLENAHGRVSPTSRVQVELKRQGTTVDAPWGPVLITDEQGNGRIDHIRVGDTFRLRAWGQDGSTTVTEWKKMTAETGKVVTIKLSPVARR